MNIQMAVFPELRWQLWQFYKMNTVTNIRNLNYADYDEVWAIVRSLKNPGRMKQVAESKTLMASRMNRKGSRPV